MCDFQIWKFGKVETDQTDAMWMWITTRGVRDSCHVTCHARLGNTTFYHSRSKVISFGINLMKTRLFFVVSCQYSIIVGLRLRLRRVVGQLTLPYILTAGFRDNSSEPVASLICLEWQPSAWALVQTRATGGDVGYFVLCVYTCTQDWRVHQSWLCKCTEVWAQQGWRGGCQASQHQQGKIELATATTGQARNTSLQYWSVLSTQVTLHS